MLPDRVSNPGPLTYESGALPIALRGPASVNRVLSGSALLAIAKGLRRMGTPPYFSNIFAI